MSDQSLHTKMISERLQSINLRKKSKKILVVEDDHGVRLPLLLRLRKLGFNVIVATDGPSAIEAVKMHKPDLVILDLFLPRLSGEEVCKAIKEGDDEELFAIPVIMVTAKDSIADKIVGRSIGANAYITKPFEFEELYTEMQKLHLCD